MPFALRLAYRDGRRSWRRLALFFLSLALGVATMATVRSLISGARTALQREARSLLAADLVVSTNRPWDDALRAKLDPLLSRPAVRARSASLLTSTMATGSERSPEASRMSVDSRSDSDRSAPPPRLVELRAVEANFPLRGTVELANGQTFSSELLANHGALVAPELLDQLELRVGEALLLGGARFSIRGVVLREPGRQTGAFSLGPRVLVALDDLRASPLLGFGARARHVVSVNVDEAELDALRDDVREAFPQEFVTVRTWRKTESQVGSDLDRTEGYLSLVGFAVLVLGGIGVASVVRVFVDERRKTVAILECLGLRPRQVLLAYASELGALALAAGGVGLALATLVLAGLPSDLLASLGDVRPRLGLGPALVSLASGWLVAALFALAPLLELLRIKPLLVLRDEPAAPASRSQGRAVRLAALVGLFGLAVLSAGSWRTGALAAAGLLGVAATLLLIASGLVRASAGLARRLRFPWRHALLRASRPGNTTRPVLLSLGLGSLFIFALFDLRVQLLRQLSFEQGRDDADLFLIDVQPDQAEPLARLLAERRAPARFVPVLRARLIGVLGRELKLADAEDVRERGLGREFTITYRERLEANERVVEGAFWEAGTSAEEPEVSVEKNLAERGLHLGDRLRFDVLGRRIVARVTSVRVVDWGRSRGAGGFVLVFRPGSLRGAPETRIAFVQAPAEAAPRASLQRDVARAFPNVSSVDLRDVLKVLEQLLGRLALAISGIGGLTLLLGVVILLGTVALTRYERRKENAILRALGARPRTLALLVTVEHALLGALAGLTGAIGALGLSWALCRFVFELPWQPAWAQLAVGIGALALATGLFSLLFSLDVLRVRPLEVLREG